MSWMDKFFHKKKPIIFCVHGFGVRRSLEFEPLKKYFENLGYEVVIPEIFDQTQMNDTDPSEWIRRIEEPLENLISQNKSIFLVGFSMGGVIASNCAAKYDIERLVLLAPAFEYITAKAILDTVEGVARQIINRPEVIASDFPPLPDNFTSTFKEVVSMCKESISKVQCPVLIFHGTEDKVIPLRSSDYAYESIQHDNKRLFQLKDVPHRILDETPINQDVLKMIHHYFLNQILEV